MLIPTEAERYRDLRRLMAQHDLSAQDVADKLSDIGIRKNLVYRWLTPSLDRPIPLDTLRLLQLRLELT